MTRDEDAIIEAKKYYRNDIKCYDAFLHGVEWVEEQIANLWHDASETPKKNRYILIEVVITLTPKNVIGYYVEYTENTVVKIMKTEGFRCRWAYISELLPKGGKE